MNYHIVRTNDVVNTILNMYNLTMTELVDLNKHITNWNNLVPGTRIKLPAISEAITEELNDVEPFIEDYYPKIDLTRFESKDESIEEEINFETIYTKEEPLYNKEEEIISNDENKKNSNFTSSIKLPYNYYNPYNYYRYPRRKGK